MGKSFLNWTSSCGGIWINNGCPKDMCFNEIGLFVQKVLDVSLGSIFNTSRRAYVIK
jgi:hypothetical protein